MLLPDWTNANQTLAKDGWCWWYRKYAPGDTGLEGLEREAREVRKGLWADLQPVRGRGNGTWHARGVEGLGGGVGEAKQIARETNVCESTA